MTNNPYAVMIGKAVLPDGTEVYAVDARELHAKLGVKSEFGNWIRRRIDECRLIEDVDFIVVKNYGVGIIEKKDYFLALDAAKHVAMMERNDAGFAIRQQFIDFEKKTRAALASGKLMLMPDFTDPAAAARAWADEYEGRMLAEKKTLALESKVAEYAPKAEGFDQFLKTEDSMTFREVGNTLGMSAIRLCAILRANGMLTKTRKTGSFYGLENRERSEKLSARNFAV